jgi:hypothetical protein
MPELNPSEQRCLLEFFKWGFKFNAYSWEKIHIS